MQTLFGGEKSQRCPGESDCVRFQSAKGKTHSLKVKNACSNCELLPTKPIDRTRKTLPLDDLVFRAFRIKEQNDAGYQVPETRMSAIEFDALLQINEEFSAFARWSAQHQVKTFAMIQGFFNGNNQ